MLEAVPAPPPPPPHAPAGNPMGSPAAVFGNQGAAAEEDDVDDVPA